MKPDEIMTPQVTPQVMTPEEIMVHEYKEEMKGCRTLALGLICMAICSCAIIYLVVRYAEHLTLINNLKK